MGGDVNIHIDININIDIHIIINMNIENYDIYYVLFIIYSLLAIPFWLLFTIGYFPLAIPTLPIACCLQGSPRSPFHQLRP